MREASADSRDLELARRSEIMEEVSIHY
ncbi:unnamed protein product [Knipowitschia caucasica]